MNVFYHYYECAINLTHVSLWLSNLPILELIWHVVTVFSYLLIFVAALSCCKMDQAVNDISTSQGMWILFIDVPVSLPKADLIFIFTYRKKEISVLISCILKFILPVWKICLDMLKCKTILELLEW